MPKIELIKLRPNRTPKRRTDYVVMYHANCADGACSAALVVSAIQADFNLNGAESYNILCIPVRYGSEDKFIADLPDIFAHNGMHKKIDCFALVDFAFTSEHMKQICDKMNTPRVYYFDHHETMKDELQKFREEYSSQFQDIPCIALYGDAKDSGASLTYKYVKEMVPQLNNERVKHIIELCRDYDLWIHKYSETMPFINGMTSGDISIKDWLKLLLDDADGSYLEKCKSCGAGIIAQQKNAAVQIEHNPDAKVVNIGKYRIAIINIPAAWVNIVSNELIKDRFVDAVLSYSIGGIDKVYVSMRSSQKEGSFDCGAFMSKWFNGGGHHSSAGGRIDNFELFVKTIERTQNAD